MKKLATEPLKIVANVTTYAPTSAAIPVFSNALKIALRLVKIAFIPANC
jgi:hypothetical protein